MRGTSYTSTETTSGQVRSEIQRLEDSSSTMKYLLLLTMLSLSRGFYVGRTGRLRALARSTNTFLDAKKENKSSTTTQRVGEFWEARMGCWRPTVNDVERISWGKPAKKKGTGSRGAPHRLNEDERFLFEQARRKGFLEITGSGWRSQRREAPLLNSYRSLCDARGQASIVLHKSSTGVDELVVDISPLRIPEKFPQIADSCQHKFENGEIVSQGSIISEDDESPEEGDEEAAVLTPEDMLNSWETRPIYQLPPYCIAWELERSQAKDLGKEMAVLFCTKEEHKVASKKPIGVKPGKGRRHGGYGIG